MEKDAHSKLSRRERQIMDVVYRRLQASAAEVRAGLPDPPGYSAVRAMLRILEDKGWLTHKRIERRYVYIPTVPREKATRSALRNLLNTFFDGSVEKAVAALLDADAAKLTNTEYQRLAALIDEARKEGR
jgi:BlaI family transcriptional regulator, penicillinase repressor